MMNVDENCWRTSAFRHNVVQKIEEALQNSGMIRTRTSIEMESHVFQKAKSKDEYLGYVARLILHVRDMNSNKKQQINGQQVQDPMNALRAMAHQGTGNQMMNLIPQQTGPQLNATNLLQTLNQRPNLQHNMPGIQPGVMGQMGGPINPMQQAQMHPGPVGNQMNAAMPNQMNTSVNPSISNVTITRPCQMMNVNAVNAGPMPSQINMSGQIPNQMTGQIAASMSGQIGGLMSGPMNNMQSNQLNQQVQLNHLAAPRKMVPDGIMIPNQGNVAYIQSRAGVPNQFIRQNTPPPQASPMGMNSVNNMIPSPALVHSPSPAQLPGTGGLVGPVMKQAGSNMAPSPISSVTLNTPGGQSQPISSPCSNDEQAYRDKVKQLSRYIEPLRRMISRLGSGDHEKMSKMKKLLEILSSPGQRITMETLLKCEVVLEKLDIKVVADGQMKEQHPLIEAVCAALQSPNPNHTFQRTFEPVMVTLNGKSLKNLPRPLKRKYVEDVVSDIPEVLQGEVARLDQRFKVSLDPVQQSSSKSIYLLCWLDDRHLPCIPPVQIIIPDDYPASSPKCDMSYYEYGATKFLQMIQEALQSHISKLPSKYTISQLLDTWENSVRETCSPNRVSHLNTASFLTS